MTLSGTLGGVIVGLACSLCAAGEAIDVGSRLEPFVDEHLIERMTDARLVLHHPATRQVAVDHNEPSSGWSSSGDRSGTTSCSKAKRGSISPRSRTSIRTANRTIATRR